MDVMSPDNITSLLTKFLDVQSQKAQVIAGNIANADTPGYLAKELKFDEYLREAVRQANLPRSKANWQDLSPEAAQPQIVEQTPTSIGLDGNTVDAGREMSELAQTAGNFNFGAKMLQSRFRLLRQAINEGR